MLLERFVERDCFEVFRDPGVPAQLPLDAAAQGIGGLGFAVSDVSHVRGFIRGVHPTNDFVGVGMRGESFNLYDLGLNGDVLAVNPEFLCSGRQVGTACSSGLVAAEDDGVFRIRP